MAIAHDAVDHLATVYAAAGLGPAPVIGADALVALRALIAGLIPLGPSLTFLLRLTELDEDEQLGKRIDELDEPVRAAISAAQRCGDLDVQIPAGWAVETLFASVYVAWEQIEAGRLAQRAAADLVTRTWLTGIAAAPGMDRQ